MAALDLAFNIQGASVPADHGYTLFSAICRMLEQHVGTDGRTISGSAKSSLGGSDGHVSIGVHPINGQYIGSGQLQLTAKSRLRLRVSTDQIPLVLPLAGKAIDLAGYRVRIGVPTVHSLVPAATLASRLVIIKGCTTPESLLEKARWQLDQLGISREANLGIPLIQTGPRADQPHRRVLRIKDKKVIGFAVRITGLSAEESLRIQDHEGLRAPGAPPDAPNATWIVPPLGLGGRRTMGCGIFVPVGPMPT